MRPDPRAGEGVARRITGFPRDEEGHWVAELECGHGQHVRHDPPWQSRPWVTSAVVRVTRPITRVEIVVADTTVRPGQSFRVRVRVVDDRGRLLPDVPVEVRVEGGPYIRVESVTGSTDLTLHEPGAWVLRARFGGREAVVPLRVVPTDP